MGIGGAIGGDRRCSSQLVYPVTAICTHYLSTPTRIKTMYHCTSQQTFVYESLEEALHSKVLTTTNIQKHYPHPHPIAPMDIQDQ